MPSWQCTEYTRVYRTCSWCIQMSLCHPWDLDDKGHVLGNGRWAGWYCDPCWLWFEIEEMKDYYRQELVEEMPQCTVIATQVFGQPHLMRSICSFLPESICFCEVCIEDYDPHARWRQEHENVLA